MTAMLDTIRRLVERLSPAPVCDACIARHLELVVDDSLHASLGELSVERGFQRDRATCSLCDEHGPVILKQGRQYVA